MSKRGRPKKENPRDKTLMVRLTNEEYEELIKTAKDYNMSKSEIFRNGIKLVRDQFF